MKEIRKLSRSDLRKLCIEKDWYTRGDNEEYSNVLSLAGDCEDVTTAVIVEIATDIINQRDTEHTVSSACFEIARICNSFFE